MKRAAWICAAALTLWPLGGAQGQASRAVPPPEAPATLQMQLEQLNRSMAELVALLRESTERQRLEILLKRIELHHLDLEPLQEELRRARADKVSQEEEQMRLQALLNDLDDQAASKEPEVLQPSDPEQRSIRHGLEVQIKFLKGRIESAERKVAELENELADKRRQIDLLERMIDDRLRAWVR